MTKLIFGFALSFLFGFSAAAQSPIGTEDDRARKFRALDPELPTPNMYRGASGAPGPAYWQQQVDYVIDAELDEDAQRLSASMTITYTNNSPDTLQYLWLALDQNRFKDGSLARMSETYRDVGTRRDASGRGDSYSFAALNRYQGFEDQEYGFEIQAILGEDGQDISYVVNDTMLRLNLGVPLAPTETVIFSIDWEHNILDEAVIGGRGGFEYFPEEDNYIFGMAQWFPRLAAYTDYAGWQNRQFLGRGEFTLEFGDYEVNLTVPADHIVAASGVLQNQNEVLTAKQRNRLKRAGTEEITFIVSPEEALDNQENKSRDTKTWEFKADNVRDFAWSSSRKYIWDAMIFEQDDPVNPEVLAMSFYPNEAEPIWSKYSTHAVVHTMDVYNRFAFNYPYPTAQSVNSWERGGMEYPMITFNGYRPKVDPDTDEITYSRNVKYGLVGVIIHEIGHIYFPMVVNSDEREWTWMDEGINTFLEYMAEYEWEENFPIRGNMQNPLDQITRYMTSSDQVPIMTQSDTILQFGSNAYAKPAAALIVLRETVMGRELFDHAFREYATRWRFKRPTPADFFRTMEDASAVDLDWFWRGWFYTTDHVDIAISDVREYQISTQDPEREEIADRTENLRKYPENIVQRRNRDEGVITRVDRFESLNDFYNDNDKFTATPKDQKDYESFLDGLRDWEKEAFERALEAENYLYFIDFDNIGGLISPLPLKITFEDDETEEIMLPAEIWRRDPVQVTKLLVLDKPVAKIELDTAHQTADADFSNNSFPPQVSRSRLELYKSSRKDRDMMNEMLTELRKDSPATEDETAGVPLSKPSNDNQDDDINDAKEDSNGEENGEEENGEENAEDQIEQTLKRILDPFIK
ncbi:MAG: M1 family metallopeptidase [Hellea sp.]|nr:M1 family metallopeptidase [Hellea sp.]